MNDSIFGNKICSNCNEYMAKKTDIGYDYKVMEYWKCYNCENEEYD